MKATDSAAYILGRARQLGLSATQLAGQLHLTYPTLHLRLTGQSDWRSSEIKALAEVLELGSAELYALTVDRTVPGAAPADFKDNGEIDCNS